MEKKFTQHLVYAIGEITLVMIGILLALKVNNWNEDRKDEKFEQEISTLVDQNLVNDSIWLTKEMFKTIDALQLTDRLLEQVDQKKYTDSLNFWMGRIISFERFKSQSRAFEVIKSKGIENKSDKRLQILLIAFYEESLLKFHESMNDILSSFNADWIPVIKQDFSDFKWMEYHQPNDLEAFLKNQPPESCLYFIRTTEPVN